MTAAIETERLGKRYRRTWALADCTLTVPAGHVVGLFGPPSTSRRPWPWPGTASGGSAATCPEQAGIWQPFSQTFRAL